MTLPGTCLSSPHCLFLALQNPALSRHRAPHAAICRNDLQSTVGRKVLLLIPPGHTFAAAVINMKGTGQSKTDRWRDRDPATRLLTSAHILVEYNTPRTDPEAPRGIFHSPFALLRTLKVMCWRCQCHKNRKILNPWDSLSHHLENRCSGKLSK